MSLNDDLAEAAGKADLTGLTRELKVLYLCLRLSFQEMTREAAIAPPSCVNS